jgi:hypothetical protein
VSVPLPSLDPPVEVAVVPVSSAEVAVALVVAVVSAAVVAFVVEAPVDPSVVVESSLDVFSKQAAVGNRAIKAM